MTESSKYMLRSITTSDQPFLWEVLYQAIYVPQGVTPPPRGIITSPELARYVAGWGQDDDLGLLATETINHRPAGAVWLRLLRDDNRGYGYIDDETPELSIAVLPQYRGEGLGTQLMTSLFSAAHNRYKAISLSVSKDNPALRLYRRLGFEIFREEGESIIMKKGLRATQPGDANR